MVMSINTEKVFDKTPHTFMIKSLQQVGIGRTYLNSIKAIYDKPTTNILQGERFSIGKDVDSHPFIQHRFWSPSHGNQRGNRNKGIQIGKEVAKLLISADDMKIYIENPKCATRKPLELINEFNNTQKSLTFLHTNIEREIKQFHVSLHWRE